VYLEPREHVWWVQTWFFYAGGASSALPNSLAGFERPLRSREREGKGRKRGKKKWKERK